MLSTCCGAASNAGLLPSADLHKDLILLVHSKLGASKLPLALEDGTKLLIDVLRAVFPTPVAVFGDPPAKLSSDMTIVLPNGAVVTSMSNRPTDDALQAAETRSLRVTIRAASTRASSDMELFMELGNLEAEGNGYLIFTKDEESKVLFDCRLCKDSTRKKDTTHGGSCRHLCSKGHVSKWLLEHGRPANQTKELQERLPSVYTPARRRATAQDQVAATMRARGRGGRGRGRGALPPTPPGPPNFGAQAAAAEDEADGIADGL